MAKTKIEVDLDIQDGDSVSVVEKKATSLKQKLKDMKELLASGTLDAGAFNKLSKEAGDLQDRIQDVSQRVKNLASDSQKLDGFVSIAQGIVGGFAAVQGITALVGEENEDLQKTMVKLQGAMSALAGIQAIANTLNKDSAALTALTTLRTQAAIVVQTIYTAVVGGSTGAMKAFKIALAASGIGLIVLALVAAAKAMGAFGDETDATTDAIKKQTDALKERTDAIKVEDNADIESFRQKIEIEKAKLKLAGASNVELLNKDKEFLEFKRGFLTEQLKDVYMNEELKKKAQAEFDKNTNDIRLKNYEIAQFNKDTADKKAQIAKDKLDAFNKARDERIKKQKEDEAAAEIKENFELEQERKEIKDLIDARDKKQRDDALSTVYANGQERLRIGRLIFAREKQEREDELKQLQANEDAKIAITQGAFDILNNIGEIFIGQQYRQTAIGKVLALTQIAIDTARAISSLTAASEANPTNAVTYGLAGAAQFVAGLARITANVLQAKRVLSGGGIAGGSGGSAGTGAGFTPGLNSQAPNVRSFSTTGQSTSQGGGLRVEVLENDITRAVNNNARIRQNAEII